MSPERVKKAAIEAIDESTPGSLPSWVSVWILRCIVWMLGLVIPLLLGAAGTAGWAVVTRLSSLETQSALTQQTIASYQRQNADLATGISNNSEAIKSIATSLQEIVTEDIPELDAKYREMVAKETLPKAEERIVNLEGQVGEIATELRETSPSDLKRALEEKFQILMERIDRQGGSQ